MSWTFFLCTFGCKVNQYESQSLRESWTRLGGRECDTPEQADWIVLNTCAVTAGAVSEVRQTARRMHRLAPEARLVITGCSATAAGEELAALPGVLAVLPQTEKERLLKGPAALAPEEAASTDPERFPGFAITSFARARPVIKIQDGCTHKCAYCIVPLMRGPSRSRATRDIVAEMRRLLTAGYREIMLSGINLRQYAMPDKQDGVDGDFWTLLRVLETEFSSEWAGTARLRLSSLDPAQLHERALETLAASRLVCPHMHLSLQSGSPDVLQAMGRGHYSPEAIAAFVGSLSSIWPVFGLGADILMGFPMETDAQAEETLAFLRSLPLSYAHVFPFSPRPGTRAASLKDLPGPLKQERALAARNIIKEKQTHFLDRLMRMDRLHVALDVSRQDEVQADEDTTVDLVRMKGVCEYYTVCMLPERTLPRAGSGHDLIPVSPAGISGSRLDVSLVV